MSCHCLSVLYSGTQSHYLDLTMDTSGQLFSLSHKFHSLLRALFLHTLTFPQTALQSPFLNAGSLLDLPVTPTISRYMDRSHEAQTTPDCVELHGAHSLLVLHEDRPFWLSFLSCFSPCFLLIPLCILDLLILESLQVHSQDLVFLAFSLCW